MAEEAKELTIKQSFNELGEVKKAFTAEQVKFVMSTIAPSLNESETWLFLLKSQKLGLNPLLGEIFAYASTSNGKRQLVIIEGRNGKRNLAAKTGKVEYIKTEAIYTKKVHVPADKEKGTEASDTVIVVPPWDGTLWGAKCEVKLKDNPEPFVVQVPLSEYKLSTPVWNSKAETMIKKVAESQALSMALPNAMGDLLGEEENFISQEPKALPTVPNANKPADEGQLATLKSLGADMSREYTGQEAVEEIDRLLAEKRKVKKAEKTEKPAQEAKN